MLLISTSIIGNIFYLSMVDQIKY